MMMSWETNDIISRLNRSFKRKIERCDYSDHKECLSFQVEHGLKGYEIFFFPEELNYNPCLELLSKDDVVFDVGAGDLRFDLIMAEMVKKVYAIEINPTIVSSALRIIGYDLPENLTVICGNGFDWNILPKDVTAVTCLMIHRQHEFPIEWQNNHRIIYADHEGIKVLSKLINGCKTDKQL